MSRIASRIKRRAVGSASFYFSNRPLSSFTFAPHNLDRFCLLSGCVVTNTVKAYPVETRELGPISDEQSSQHRVFAVVVGVVIYHLLVALALRAGLQPNDLKLITAALLLLALAVPRWRL